jgi:hypothetical protein
VNYPEKLNRKITLSLISPLYLGYSGGRQEDEMEILLPEIKLMTYLGYGLIIIGLLAIRGIFRGSRSKFNYVVGSLLCIGLGLIIITSKSSGSITVTEDSLKLKALLSKTHIIESDEIKRAWVEEFENSQWRPVSRSSGTALGNLRTGWFRLQNGLRAFCIVEGEQGLYIETHNGRFYLIGLEDFSAFVRQVKSNSSKLRQLLQ